MLQLFLLADPLRNPRFTKYVCRIARAWNMPCESNEDKLRIVQRITELPSFVKKLGQPKLQNWFAWNQQMEDHQLRDFYATKMIFEDQLPDEPDPDETNCFSSSGPAGRDPRNQLRAILQHGGGIRLAYKLMTSELHLNEKVLWVAEKSSRDWYTKQLKEVVTPKDAVQYSINMATGWTSDNNISNTFEYTLRTPSYLRLIWASLSPILRLIWLSQGFLYV